MKYLKYFENSKDIRISSQSITTLKDEKIPEILHGNLDCSNNMLHDIIGSPKIIYGNFDCKFNILLSLIGSPEIVYGDFDCTFNSIRNLDGSPKEIHGNFDCRNNQLTSLDNGPEIVTNTFFCKNNPWKFPIPLDIIKKYRLSWLTIYTHEQEEKFRSYEYQKDFLTKYPERYKDLIYLGYDPKIKEEFDWLFNASDMGLM